MVYGWRKESGSCKNTMRVNRTSAGMCPWWGRCASGEERDLLPQGDRPSLDLTVPWGQRVAERPRGAAPSARASLRPKLLRITEKA